MEKIKVLPKEIKEEYQKGCEYKASIGDSGIYEQSKKNERFYVGDQWYGCKAGNNRPLVRRNVIKRIGEHKMAVIASPSVSVNFSAEGIPNTVDMEEESAAVRQGLVNGQVPMGNTADEIEISAITSAMSDYFNTTAERIKFDMLKETVLKNAYISGTGILFIYWDDGIETGLYADAEKQVPIKGDIACEVLDVENVNFGDPNLDDIQKQPYIIIARRRNVEDVRREARRNQQPTDDIKPDNADSTHSNAGDRGENEPTEHQRVTVYTKLYKEWDKTDKAYRVMAVRTTEKAYVRKPWSLKLRNYPLAKFGWEKRRSCIYGDSEITYLIPNQIAINRALTAAVWGVIQTGMPIMLVNGDTVTQQITNEPGQIIKVYGDYNDVAGAARYIEAPNSTTQFQNIETALFENTRSDSGVNDAAVGNMRPDNASAIIQLQEAALMPMQMYINRFYSFIEDVARIWVDFWIHYYGKRRLKVSDKNGVQYIIFDAERYKNLLFTARIDIGAATVYSESLVISTLDALLGAKIINPLQYLERLPKRIVPDLTGLINDVKAAQTAPMPSENGGEITDEEIIAALQQQNPKMYGRLMSLPPEQQAELLAALKSKFTGQQVPTNNAGMETEEIGDI